MPYHNVMLLTLYSFPRPNRYRPCRPCYVATAARVADASWLNARPAAAFGPRAKMNRQI